MASAFQASAFQDSAFQIDSVATTTTGGGQAQGGHGVSRRKRGKDYPYEAHAEVREPDVAAMLEAARRRRIAEDDERLLMLLARLI